MYEDNIIHEPDKSDIELIKEYKDNGRIVEDFFPLMTYDMVQSGYPRTDHGIMVSRPWGGTNEKNELIDGGGMWCKVEDVLKLINDYKKFIKGD